MTVFSTSPEEKEIGVVLHHGVGLTGQVTKPGQVEPGSRGYLQHAAPGLVTQQLHLCRIQQPFLCALVPVSEPEGQGVVQTAHSNAHRLPVDCQDPGIQDDLRKFRPAALAQRPPFRGELAATRKGVQMRKNAERCEEDSRGKHPEKRTKSYLAPPKVCVDESFLFPKCFQETQPSGRK